MFLFFGSKDNTSKEIPKELLGEILAYLRMVCSVCFKKFEDKRRSARPEKLSPSDKHYLKVISLRIGEKKPAKT